MASVTALSIDGTDIGVKGEAVESLAGRMRGSLLRPESEGYDEARRVWNGMIDRHPALIGRCAGTADVQACVGFAREHDLLVSVKGGSHNFAGKGVCDGAFMIDLSAMRLVHVDAGRRRARAAGGAKWADYDTETHAYGLASTGGTVSDTGVGGLTLGGGIGWLAGSYGLACDNLVSADVVLADGSIVAASLTENDDLFWGLRGGSGNFGVVTSFEFELHPVDTVLAGPVFHPFADAARLLRHYCDFAADIPDGLNTGGVLLHTPDGHPVAGAVGCWNGPADAGERVLRPLRDFGAPLVDDIGRIPYPAIQTALDPAFLPGRRYYSKGHLITDVTDECVATLVDFYARTPSPANFIILQQLGNATNRVDPAATAFSHRRSRYELVLLAGWDDAADDERNVGWVRELWDATAPFSDHALYVNSIVDDDEAVIRSAYRSETFERLSALKARYDPTNFFRLNPNIPPAA